MIPRSTDEVDKGRHTSESKEKEKGKKFATSGKANINIRFIALIVSNNFGPTPQSAQGRLWHDLNMLRAQQTRHLFVQIIGRKQFCLPGF